MRWRTSPLARRLLRAAAMHDYASMPTLPPLTIAQEQLCRLYLDWVRDNRFDEIAVAAAHERATVAMHDHYCARIPSYARLAADCGLSASRDAAAIRGELLSSEDAFKSYDPALVRDADYPGLTRWLDDIYFDRLAVDDAIEGCRTVESWLATLAARGIALAYSSGTSGQLSFVPRDPRTRQQAGLVGSYWLAQWLMRSQATLRDFDAVLLTHAGGGQGLSQFALSVGQAARSRRFLFERAIDADALRARLGGAPADGADERAAAFARIAEHLAERAQVGARALLVSTPFSLVELCRRLPRSLTLARGSWIMLGGGWKTFDGERLPRAELLALVEAKLGVPPTQIDEAYSMIECNLSLPRCAEDRFHVPPLLWPMVLDDAMQPRSALGRGRFAFCDPLATSYSGFFASGDEVELTRDPCRCGRSGWTLVGEVRRAHGQQARGCAALIQKGA